MSKRHTQSTLALAALLAGALALPGLAAADWDRDGGGGGRGDRHGERHYDHDGGRGERRHEGGDRHWGERGHYDHDHWRHHRDYREREVVVERPVYRRPPLLPGLSVFFNGSW
ncbi:hypothetical protein [uncultured Thiodictyon sp.]|uniref:hypothetical protein n=1 Tax=uncultured Thiodictyon sp. TaxID=1846217 RepID=UPI0025EF7F60|nr:hypothetical protein [uncultured Thiodictyon sp.]